MKLKLTPNFIIAPGVSFTDKRSTDEEVKKVYWNTLNLRDKIAPERNLKSNPFTGEEILAAFRSPENREQFPDLFAQQKSKFPELYNNLEIPLPPTEEKGYDELEEDFDELEIALAISMLPLEAASEEKVAPLGESNNEGEEGAV